MLFLGLKFTSFLFFLFFYVKLDAGKTWHPNANHLTDYFKPLPSNGKSLCVKTNQHSSSTFFNPVCPNESHQLTLSLNPANNPSDVFLMKPSGTSQTTQRPKHFRKRACETCFKIPLAPPPKKNKKNIYKKNYDKFNESILKRFNNLKTRVNMQKCLFIDTVSILAHNDPFRKNLSLTPSLKKQPPIDRKNELWISPLVCHHDPYNVSKHLLNSLQPVHTWYEDTRHFPFIESELQDALFHKC